ncbi:4-alpha-glucanotransferase [Deltaproteobacteria bacterium Smac51]|nr:4-alpha-glucanotransferase [Deltaproteobacteria bacterium Smac51]
MLDRNGWRAGGILLHPTSLHSRFGVGDLGPAAHHMVRFIKKAGLNYWQVLPLGPTGPGLGNSPYSAYSAFAGNPLLISPDLMARDGWLEERDLEEAEMPPRDQVSFEAAIKVKQGLIDLAFERAATRLDSHQAFQDFCWQNGTWLNDYAFFMAAKHYLGGHTWLAWPEKLRRRDGEALHEYGTLLRGPIQREKFAQYLFFSQLAELKALMHENGIGLIGDTAIYVNHDSSDVWAQPYLFHLNENGCSTVVAGVPPDYFAEFGQLWGNPLFNWPAHAAQGYDWWKNRLWNAFKVYDMVRLDHFRAFAAYWEVPAEAETAASGHWVPGPGADLFRAASQNGPLRIIAEDLGIITPDVTRLRCEFGYPGMRVLQFAFGPDLRYSTHAPYRIEMDNAVYPATHDNNTTRGWYRMETTPLQRNQLEEMAGFKVDESNAAWALTRLAWLSTAGLAVVTMQDLLNLDEKSRMNTPGTAEGNWGWRLTGDEQLSDELAAKIAGLNDLSGRDNFEHPNTLTY